MKPWIKKTDHLSIVLNGQTFSVENNVNDIGQALYLAINHQQVQDVERFFIDVPEITWARYPISPFCSGEFGAFTR